MSTVDVVAGRAAVAVAREKMQAGDLVEVRTPNAVAGIRDTDIVAEVFDPNYSAITVLKGVIDVKRIDGGNQGEVERTARYLGSLQASATVDRCASQKVVDDDQDALGEQDGAGMRRDADGKPEKADKVERAERSGKADRGRDRGRMTDTTSAVKANGPSATSVSNLGEALKHNDRGARKIKNRDR